MGLFNGGIFKSINKAFTQARDFNVHGLKIATSALFPGAGQYMAQQETNALNEKLTREANALNAANWDKQTLYNSPAEQMKRLEAAGLNPNLAYGQIAESKMASAPTMEAPRHQAATFGDGIMPQLSAYSQVLNNQELNKKLRLENDYTAYEIRKLKESGMLRGDSGQLRFWERLPSMVGDRANALVEWMKNYSRQSREYKMEQSRKK